MSSTCFECGMIGHVVCQNCYDDLKFTIAALRIEAYDLDRFKKKYRARICKSIYLAEKVVNHTDEQKFMTLKLQKKIKKLKEQLNKEK